MCPNTFKKSRKKKSLQTQKIMINEIYKYYHFVRITQVFALKCELGRQEFQNGEVRSSELLFSKQQLN